MKKACILPTGDEICEGIVLDTDSPEVMAHLLARWPSIEVIRMAPVRDEENAIASAVDCALRQGADLILLLGGSGGGHRYSQTLGCDYTHSALEHLCERAACRSIYGKNGHLWTRLICGERAGARLLNLPGPFVEAQAAISAFCRVADASAEEIVDAVTGAVVACYPEGAV